MDGTKRAYKTVAQVKEMSDRQCMAYLLGQWSMSSPLVKGVLAQRGDTWWLTEVTDSGQEPLEYPISDLPERDKRLRGDRGIFVGPNLKPEYGEGAYVSAVFELSKPNEREKHKNQLLIRAKTSTLKALPAPVVSRQVDGAVDVKTSLVRNFEQKPKDLAAELQQLNRKSRKNRRTSNISKHWPRN